MKNKLFLCQKLKVIGIGVETFTKLIANGVFPGYGGYEVTENNKSNMKSPTSEVVTEKNINNIAKPLSDDEINFLKKVAEGWDPLSKKTDKEIKSSQIINTSETLKNFEIKSLSEIYTMSNSKERRVPSSRISRLFNFGALAVGLGSGAVAEVTRRTLGINKNDFAVSNPFLTPTNAERIVNTLCRVRGAALKLGQMLSIQDDEMIPPYLAEIFERVRQSADFMPITQVHSQLEKELGINWRDNFIDFNDKPFAAASIGQVHKATHVDGTELAVKIQYPGVAESIDSDINNLVSVLNFSNFFPKGMFLDNFVVVARRELKFECNYKREARAMVVFSKLFSDLNSFYVPKVYTDLSTERVIISEFVEGVPIDRCTNESQKVRNFISEKFIELCLREIFEWKFMQTDPNWSNFLFGKHPKTGAPSLILLDFGASRSYSHEFIDKYMKLIRSAYDGNKENVLKYSREIGFLTGYESKVMNEAHLESIMILAELLTSSNFYDFSTKNVTKRISKLIPVMLEHRLTSPPDEIYSLHRKLSGSYLISSKLRAVVSCCFIFKEISNKYKFNDVGYAIDIDKTLEDEKLQ